MTWEFLGSAKLSGTADIITVDPIEVRESIALQAIVINDGTSQIEPAFRFNNDSGSNYIQKISTDGGSYTTSTGQTSIELSTSTAPVYINTAIQNLASDDKLAISNIVSRNTAGAGNVVNRWENQGEWTNSSNAIVRIDLINNGSGDFGADSELVIFGSD